MIKKLVLILMVACCAVMAQNESFAIKANPTENGSIHFYGEHFANKELTKYYPDKELGIQLIPEQGYAVDSFYVSSDDGTRYSVTADGSNYKMTMPHKDITVFVWFKKKVSSITVTGCEEMACVYPTSAEFGEDVEIKITKSPNQGFELNATGVKSVSKSAEGNDVFLKFKMGDFDVSVNITMTKTPEKPTRYGLSISGNYADHCTLKDSADVGEIVQLVIDLTNAKGHLSIGGEGIGENDLVEESDGHYKFTMPQNDVAFVVNAISQNPSNDEDLSSSSEESSSSADESSSSEVLESSSEESSSSAEESSSSETSESSSGESSSSAEDAPDSSSEVKPDTVYVVDTVPYYSVNIAASEHGEIIRTGSFVKGTTNGAYEGYDISLLVHPEAGYALESIVVTAKGGKNVDLKKEDDTFSFKMPSKDVDVSATFKITEYNIVINGCEKLKCEAPKTARMGDDVKVKIFMKDGVKGFNVSATGIDLMNRTQEGSDVIISFKMLGNDVTLNFDVTMDESASSDSKDDDKSSSSKGGKSIDKGKKDAVIASQTPMFRAVAMNRMVNVSGAKVGSIYALFDLNGGVLAQGIVGAENFSIATQKAGKFILRIGSQIRVMNIK